MPDEEDEIKSKRYSKSLRVEDNELSRRTFHFLTNFSDDESMVFLNVEQGVEISRDFLKLQSEANDLWKIMDKYKRSDLIAHLENQADELWKKSDSKEIGKLIELLRENPPSPELIAFVMLNGRSKVKIKKDAAKGGGSKGEQSIRAKTALLEYWNSDTSKRGREAVVKAWVEKIKRQEIDISKNELRKIGTMVKWLPKNRMSAEQIDE